MHAVSQATAATIKIEKHEVDAPFDVTSAIGPECESKETTLAVGYVESNECVITVDGISRIPESRYYSNHFSSAPVISIDGGLGIAAIMGGVYAVKQAKK